MKIITSLKKREILGFLNLIPLFGSSAEIISNGTFEDNLHPNFEGGRMIADYIFNNYLKH